MEYRQLGRSGLRVSALYAGHDDLRRQRARRARSARPTSTGARAPGRPLPGRRRQPDRHGRRLLGRRLRGDPRRGAAQGRRDRLLLATKARFPMGDGPNDAGLSRHHLIEACEASLRRLGTDHIDLYQVHEWDGQTPLEETLDALDTLVRQGKVRYVGCSNYSGWQLMKALGDLRSARRSSASSASRSTTRCRRARPSTSSSRSRLDQGLGILVWSPLAGGLLSGKYRRDQQRARGLAPPRATGTSRRSTTRTSSTTSSTCWSRSARRTASRRRRSRSPGCSAGPASRSLVDRRAHRRAARRQPRAPPSST